MVLRGRTPLFTSAGAAGEGLSTNYTNREAKVKAKEHLKWNMRHLLMNVEDIAEHPKAKARLGSTTDWSCRIRMHGGMNARYSRARFCRTVGKSSPTNRFYSENQIIV